MRRKLVLLCFLLFCLAAFCSCASPVKGASDPDAYFPSSPRLGADDVDENGDGWPDYNLARAALVYEGERYYSKGSGFYCKPPLSGTWESVGTVRFQIPSSMVPERELESNRISVGAPVYTNGRELAVLVNDHYVIYWKG